MVEGEDEVLEQMAKQWEELGREREESTTLSSGGQVGMEIGM